MNIKHKVYIFHMNLVHQTSELIYLYVKKVSIDKLWKQWWIHTVIFKFSNPYLFMVCTIECDWRETYFNKRGFFFVCVFSTIMKISIEVFAKALHKLKSDNSTANIVIFTSGNNLRAFYITKYLKSVTGHENTFSRRVRKGHH